MCLLLGGATYSISQEICTRFLLCCGYTFTDFPISIRLTSLALWQSNDCPSASKGTLMNMDKYFMWIHYERLHNHHKAKHNKTVCIFLGIYWKSTYLISTENQCKTIRLVHERRKSNYTVRSYCRKWDPLPPKNHYCSWVEVSFYNRSSHLIPPFHTRKNAVLYTREYTSCTYNDQSLRTFSRLNDPLFWD